MALETDRKEAFLLWDNAGYPHCSETFSVHLGILKVGKR